MAYNDKELQRFQCDFCAKLKVVPFDNTHFSIQASLDKEEMERSILLSEDTEKAWLTNNMVIN